MKHDIPGADAIRGRLETMEPAQLRKLSELSGVSYYTLHKIARGITENPGIDTVRRFVPHIDAVRQAA
jgi:hypothetical protein